MSSPQPPADIEMRPLTPTRWADLEALFGPRGACAGCWDMWWRLSRTEFERQKGNGNRAAFKTLVESGVVPGILAYVDGEPAGWCAVQPRKAYPGLARSRTLKPVDDQPVWAVTCFFVGRRFRGQGLAVRLLEAAVAYAREHDAQIVEGYPVEPRSDRMPDAWAWHGTAAAYRQAGFTEVARPSPTRPIMRRFVTAHQ
jgi:GNAT superfamily N-acetyltransferase